MVATSFRELVLTRRSVRMFRQDPVSPDLIGDLLTAVQWAPSPHNTQPWRFTILSESGRHRLATAMALALARDLEAGGVPGREIARQTGRSRLRIASAPAALLCSLSGDGLREYSDERLSALEWQMAVQSVGGALQTLFLLAHERGLGTCWMAAPMYCPDDVRLALDLPADEHPQALVLLGFPDQPGKVRARRPFDEVVRHR
ncbi:MAG TPA: nitroreductase family protein [Chloroflexota bacterium]|nr:nitroreductase family protein [Chloroflexota bacterium]